MRLVTSVEIQIGGNFLGAPSNTNSVIFFSYVPAWPSGKALGW